MHEIRTVLFDEHGIETNNPSRAVRGEVTEFDDNGAFVRTYEQGGLTWQVDPISLNGDEGELATRPTHPQTQSGSDD